MRFRVITRPPLPPVKAWFSIPDGVKCTQNIAALKRDLCDKIPALSQDSESLSDDEIQLSVDDFDLLNNAEVDVIRENDLVCITKCVTDRKRKVEKQQVSSPRKRQKKFHVLDSPVVAKTPNLEVVPPTVEDISSDDETSDATSEQESSSESDRSSSTSSSSELDTSDSGSDSESSATSVALPTTVTKQKSTGLSANDSLRNPKVVLHVPPGQGKSSTRSRNARRRIKRQAERELLLATQKQGKPVSNLSPNAIPLGSGSQDGIHGVVPASLVSEGVSALDQPINSPTGIAHDDDPELLTSLGASARSMALVSSLRNKNKKNGFKRTMSERIPQKIVFEYPPTSNTVQDDIASGPDNNSHILLPPTKSTSRLIAPSEKEARGELPSNIFVTSVELEDGKWNRKKKKSQRNLYGTREDGNDGVENGWAEQVMDIENLVESGLDYGTGSTLDHKLPGSDLDWTELEKKWASFGNVVDVASLKVGQMLGRKDLAINPATLTPETMINVARVISMNIDDLTIVVREMPRPGAGQISFAGVDPDDIDGDNVTEESYFTFDDVIAGDWKLIV